MPRLERVEPETKVTIVKKPGWIEVTGSISFIKALYLNSTIDSVFEINNEIWANDVPKGMAALGDTLFVNQQYKKKIVRAFTEEHSSRLDFEIFFENPDSRIVFARNPEDFTPDEFFGVLENVGVDKLLHIGRKDSEVKLLKSITGQEYFGPKCQMNIEISIERA